MDFSIIKYPYGFLTYSVQIWDTAGLEKYRAITKSYFHFSNAILVLVDTTDTFSLAKLEFWLQEIEGNLIDINECQVVVALTKTDQACQIDMNFLDVICYRYNLLYFHTSSKTGENVQEAFNFLIKSAIVKKNKTLISKNAELFRESKPFLEKGVNECSLSTKSPENSSLCLSINGLKKSKDDEKCRC